MPGRTLDEGINIGRRKPDGEGISETFEVATLISGPEWQALGGKETSGQGPTVPMALQAGV